MPSYRDIVDLIINGQAVDAPTANRPLEQIQENVRYLKTLLDTTVASEAVFDREASIISTALVGQPVYYNASTQQYELALADGTGKQNTVGLVYDKENPTKGSILLVGHATLDLSDAVSPVLAGRYFLSTSVAGKLTTTLPTTQIVLVCITDGLGKVWVLPQYRDFPGPQGSQGSQGFQGYAGTLLSGTGVSTDANAPVFTKTVADGMVGVGTVKNTGVTNGLTVREEATDAFGITDAIETNVVFGGSLKIALDVGIATARPPYTSYTLKVRSQSAGNSTTYSAKMSVVPA